MNIFIITANSQGELTHLNQTIKNPIERSRVEQHFTDQNLLDRIEQEGNGMYAWGVLSGRLYRVWSKMEVGDYAVFVVRNEPKYLSKIIYKLNNPEFARMLWGEFTMGVTWQYMFLLSRPFELHEVDVLRNQATYNGLGMIPNNQLENAISRYGCVENYLRIRFKAPVKLPQIEESLRNDDIVELKDETTFHFEAARKLLKEFLEFEVDESTCRVIIDEYMEVQNQGRNYYEYVISLSEETAKRKFAELTGKLIAHLDYRAAGKNIWNPEGRTIAGSQIRQTYWVKNLILYKIKSVEEADLSKGVLNCIRLLESPREGLSMLSEKHRQHVSKNLLMLDYDPNKFVQELREFFRTYEQNCVNEENENVLISKVLYSDSVKPLWERESEDIAEAESYSYEHASAIKTKPFLIFAGLSGSGKSREARAIAYMYCPPELQTPDNGKPGNFELIKVRPNWHDSSELLGYESRISGNSKYIVTDFIRFLVKAWKYINVPFVLCLDEMNLAPVEQYFAEYLSVLETRVVRDGRIVSDCLISNKVFQDFDNIEFKKNLGIDDSEVSGELYSMFRKDGLCLPPNLIVIGTVNMDETTHSFSRKVLDRALTIEMNQIDLSQGLREDEIVWKYPDEIPDESILPEAVSLKNVVDYLSQNGNHKIIIDFLESLNEGLKGSPFQVAYRARDEFLYYAYYSLKANRKIEDALDDMICMKVLTRIEGDEQNTFKYIMYISVLAETRKYRNTILKCNQMLTTLKSHKFTSFWV